MARRNVLVLAAGLLVAAGCLSPPPPPPPQPPQACGLSFGSPGQYQNAFFTPGHTGTGWVTACGFVPTALPDGRTAWWMSDSMTGSANPDNSVSNVGNVHNTIVQQSGGCLTPTFGNPEMVPNAGSAWYWPGSAVVQGNTMAGFAYKLVAGARQPGVEWHGVGTSRGEGLGPARHSL